MKKLLLASTALVASAGFAAADVALSGSAEMGVKQQNGADRTEFHSDVDVRFTMTGESDNGISFGATVDLEDAAQMGGTNAETNTDYNVFISAGAATLTMGDTDGAFDKALTEVNIAGASIADDETAHAGFNGNGGLDGAEDGQVARFDYAFSGFTLSLSAELDDDGETDGTPASVVVVSDTGSPVTTSTTTTGTVVTQTTNNAAATANAAVAGDSNDNPIWGLGVAYSTDLAGLSLGVGLGYQTQEDNASATGLSLTTTFNNGLSAALNYSVTDYEASGSEDQTHVAIGLGYSVNALTIGVNYGEYTNVLGVDGADQSGFGLAAQYDLGGGLSAHLGYGSSAIDGAGVTDSYSLGLAMSF